MSNVLFPELPGLEWDLSKSPIFNTKIMTSINGRELRASFQAAPKYEISMSFAFLRESKGRKELQQLESFFIERRGSFDSFLYKMPGDNQFQCTFVGDGITDKFQIYKGSAPMTMPVSNTEPSESEDPLMWEDSPTEMWVEPEQKMWDLQYSVNSNGILELSEPLDMGEEITISGTFYYRCRFKSDEQQYTNFMDKLWKAGKVELIGSLGNKI